MQLRQFLSVVCSLVVACNHLNSSPALAADDKTIDSVSRGVEQLAESARKSIVVITVTGRDGKRLGIGTGFVVGADGIIATNLHVIGESRPIEVQFADKRMAKVIAIHATDRALDLALIAVEAKKVTPLPLGDSDAVKQGQAVIALGNPHGLNHSVVAGVISGQREIDGRPMIQLAVPIERGNSGGPVIDMQGRVLGIVTMKSLVTANLGFAVPINPLKTLMRQPNPIPMSRWITRGALDPDEWTPLFDARWRQRGNAIHVEGQGSGFGGRALCLSKQAVPDLPYEATVSVRLDDEAGAAGLVFQADGGDQHFGFYPSGGKLRLTHFQGPDVYSWKIIHNEPTKHYRPGDWNAIKVRIESKQVKCFVNGHRVFDAPIADLGGGRVGLAKFRDTRAEFKQFQVAKTIGSPVASRTLDKRLAQTMDSLAARQQPSAELVNGLAGDAASSAALRERARNLEDQAAQLRQLAQKVQHQRVLQELERQFKKPEAEVDLFAAAFWVARLDNEDIEIEPYRKQLARIGREILASLPESANARQKRTALNKHFFEELGFHGSRSEYYNRSNSYVHEVMDDREGLPITLAVLYMEIARQLGLTMVGVALPGHFVVRDVSVKGQEELIDVFDGGKIISKQDAEGKVRAITGEPLADNHWAKATKRVVIVRMIRNLLGLAQSERDGIAMLRYVDAIVILAPDSPEDRWLRAMLRYQSGQLSAAKEDVDWLVEHPSDSVPNGHVQELKRLLDRSEP